MFSQVSYGLEEKEYDSITQEFCNRSGIEVELHKTMFQAGWYADVLLKLLSGHTQEGISQLAYDLSVNILMIKNHIEYNPCEVDKGRLRELLRMVRVVAVVHHKTPFPDWENDKELIGFLEYAIQDDPKHYQKLMERSKNWENGIN